MTTSEIATVLAWHDALNERDFDTLVELSSDDVEVGDAKGAGQGHDALLEWARSAEFRVVRDHVTSMFRHADLASALAATELTEKDLAG